MALLIDGYNLLHATPLVGDRKAGLRWSREALLRFLAATLDEATRKRTTIVFDAASAPPGLPAEMISAEMSIRFARGYDDADELLEELIEADHSPRNLTVVSSDHRVQRAAQRRRANFQDSDLWFADMVRRRQRQRHTSSDRRAPSRDSVSSEDVAYWLAEFCDVEPPAEDGPAESGLHTPNAADSDLANPFPQGYAEDISDLE